MILGIVGPTGVGKTKLSIALAHRYHAIIINCDAMQVYKNLNIGTAKIKESEKEGIPHYLFDFVDPKVNYTVYDYQKDARQILDENKDKNIIFVGGTGLYLKASLYNYEFKSQTRNEYKNESLEDLQKKVLMKDFNVQLDLQNRRRLVSFLNQDEKSNKGNEVIYPHQIIGLTTNREELYKRIDKRVDEMIQKGLLDEVKTFYDLGIRSKALETGIGYKELYSYLDGHISLEEAINLIKKNSRHYAKRQYTFFRHQLLVNWVTVNYDNFDETIEEAIQKIEK